MINLVIISQLVMKVCATENPKSSTASYENLQPANLWDICLKNYLIKVAD